MGRQSRIPDLHPFRELRRLLAGSVAVRYREAAFELREHMLFTALLPEELTEPREFLLAIDSPLDTREIANLVEDGKRVKVMAPGMAFSAVPESSAVASVAAFLLPIEALVAGFAGAAETGGSAGAGAAAGLVMAILLGVVGLFLGLAFAAAARFARD